MVVNDESAYPRSREKQAKTEKNGKSFLNKNIPPRVKYP